MALRDNAIVAYAETKVMKKSDRDVWVLMGEILESLLDKSGFEKQEIDGLVMSGLTGTGGASMFWAQSTADMLGLEVGFCEQVHTGGCSAVGAVARRPAAIDAGLCEVAVCMFADTHVREHNGRNDRNYRRDWTDPYGLLGPPGAFGLLQQRLRCQVWRRSPRAWQARGDAAQPRHHERERLRRVARADHHRGLSELAHDRRSDPAARLRDAGRRCGGPDRHQQEACEGKGPAQVRRSFRLCRTDQLPRRRRPRRRDPERPRDRRQEGAGRRRAGTSRTSARFTPTTISSSRLSCRWKRSASASRARAWPSSATPISPTTARCR